MLDDRPGRLNGDEGFLGEEELLRLAGFRFEDKFVVPPDFSWCMIYTHEDYMLIRGPFFFKREWIVPPQDTSRRRRRGDRR